MDWICSDPKERDHQDRTVSGALGGRYRIQLVSNQNEADGEPPEEDDAAVSESGEMMRRVCRGEIVEE